MVSSPCSFYCARFGSQKTISAPSVRIPCCRCWRWFLWTGGAELNLKGRVRRIGYKGLRINCLFTYSANTCWPTLPYGPAQHGRGSTVLNERAVVSRHGPAPVRGTPCCRVGVLQGQGQTCPRNTDPGDLTESGDRELLRRKWWNFPQHSQDKCRDER